MSESHAPHIDVAREIQSLLREFFAAVESRDLARFLGLFTADASTTVIENSDRYDWAGFRAFAEGFFAQLAEISFELERSDVHPLGPHAAVAVGAFRGWGKTSTGEALDFRHAFTFVLARRDGRWRIAHVHESSL